MSKIAKKLVGNKILHPGARPGPEPGPRGPGPGPCAPGPGPWPPSRSCLAGAYFAVNWVNRRSLRDILALGIVQLRQLDIKPDDVSWVGYWVKHQDRGGWPLLFIHSERDPLIPWRFVSSVVAENRRRGRRVEEWRLQDTGHVDHFKRHPEEYRERVAAFLDSCLKS